MGSSVSKYQESKEEVMSSREIMNAMDGIPRKDKYVKSVVDNFKKRSQVGIEKYGTTLEREDIDLLGWLTHLQEELMDATLYVERLKSELK